MTIFIDRSFLLRVSPKLKKFSQKKEDLYNFRCPICGDSQKNKHKARGYIYRKKNGYFYMCHNCGISTTFYNFLDKVDPNLIQEYTLERYKNDSGNNNVPEPDFKEIKSDPPKFKQKLDIPSIESLPDGHFAKDYVIGRKIPESFYCDLYFTQDFKSFIESLNVVKDGLKEDDARLVIPFYNENKELICVQGRALGDSKLRYITVKLNDDTHKFFGLDKIDKDKMVYVVEGPIDSLFLENSIATADSNLSAAERVLDKSRFTLVFDNEPRNKEICKQMEKAIEEHFNIVIWPEMMEDYKDINEMITGGFSSDEIQDIISKSTFVNLRAKMEFINWKKV
jgi:transcription elongation factor Elf1